MWRDEDGDEDEVFVGVDVDFGAAVAAAAAVVVYLSFFGGDVDVGNAGDVCLSSLFG